MYLAHSPTAEHPEGQSLKDHLDHVARLAASFCYAFGASEEGWACGMFHDLGKFSDAFQRRLSGDGIKVDHSTAGAYEMFLRKNIPAALCIAGHHGGLPDIGTRGDLGNTFMGRINRAKAGSLQNYSDWQKYIDDIKPFSPQSFRGLPSYFYIKMLFSALTDADWLDTEAYFSNKEVILHNTEIEELLNRFNSYISSWREPKELINIRRSTILRSVTARAKESPGVFTLTVPTGGGKTITSMAFALNHAAVWKKKRIIYVIPYCSILEQTQKVFEAIFGENNITAHYSGAEYSYEENKEDVRAFSIDNWEGPIILTTAVQFFESLFSNRPGKNRKLHNIADSIIIFDEAQMLPVPYLMPCIAGICQLVDAFHCSVVLCTATQPVLDPIIRSFSKGAKILELCPKSEEYYRDFRRVTYRNEGTLNDEELAGYIKNTEQVLCIVNSRKQAQNLYRKLSGEKGIFHLSTLRIPADRKRAISDIRKRLEKGLKCRVISTSLIEAGVDIDFPEVYRSISGLDSIIQAGGRCNREGKRPKDSSIVHVFHTETKAPRMLEQNIAAAEKVLKEFSEIDSPEAVHEYFQHLLFTLKDEKQLDEKEIISELERLNFNTVSDRFKIIDGDEYTVYIPVGQGLMLIEQLRKNGPSRMLLKKLGQYSSSVHKDYFARLCESGKIEKIADNAGILLDVNLYSPDIGLPFNMSEQDSAIFI